MMDTIYSVLVMGHTNSKGTRSLLPRRHCDHELSRCQNTPLLSIEVFIHYFISIVHCILTFLTSVKHHLFHLINKV